MIEEDDIPSYNPYELAYEIYTAKIADLTERLMASLNEIDVVNERKIVEFDLESTQGIAKVTIQWSPVPGKTAGEMMD